MRIQDKATKKWHSICDACESPHTFTAIRSDAGLVELCYSCTKIRVPRWEIELHHSEYLDHIDEKLKPDADGHLPGYYPKEKETPYESLIT